MQGVLTEQGKQEGVQRGLVLEYITLGWNVVGTVIVILSAIAARSVALAGFGLDSLIEIFASVIVVWELTGSGGEERQRKAVRLIGIAFFCLAVYILIQSAVILLSGSRPHTSVS